MHWRWCRRSRDIMALLQSRFGSVLPNDDAGLDSVKLLAQHFMALKIDAERVTRSNIRLQAPWLTEKATAHIINSAKKAETPSAVQLGKDFRVTAEEITDLELKTIVAFTVTQEGDRLRQERRRRKAGASTKRGRPALGLSVSEKSARRKVQDAARAKRYRASRKKSHAPSYYREINRDEFSVTEFFNIEAVMMDHAGSIVLPAFMIGDIKTNPVRRMST
jgi:hypothetical protein